MGIIVTGFLADDHADIARRVKDFADGKLPSFDVKKPCKHCASGWVAVTTRHGSHWEECVLCKNPNHTPHPNLHSGWPYYAGP